MNIKNECSLYDIAKDAISSFDSISKPHSHCHRVELRTAKAMYRNSHSLNAI
jgi:hypothetical protein